MKIKKLFLFSSIFLGSLATGLGAYLIYQTSTNKSNSTTAALNQTEKLNSTSNLENTNLVPDHKKNSIRIGFWNVLNYSNKSSKTNTAKTYAISQVINSTKLDLVGLAEITQTGDGSDIVKELNTLNPNAAWKEITTAEEGNVNQKEKYTFLYKSSLLEIANFASPSNPYLIQKGVKLEWARPLAAVKFNTKTEKKEDFTFVIGHFDAPGVQKNRGEIQDKETSQGSQEAAEARDLINLLVEIDKKDGGNKEIIFMADTNIRAENSEKLFKSTLNSYRSLLDKEEKTSLSNTFGKYSNSYDKIFYKGNLVANKGQKFDIFSIFKKNIANVEKYDELRKKDGRSMNYKINQLGEINRIKGISDHTMVYFDLELGQNSRN
ncbi:endonuclease/exonuclease/phosphatase family protein [Mesomycoplasma hyopneumoniae]|uniref:endonuclease/exonuclease/phosphatase family protein n=1 Tax=Mesomycoplasma hyopneumoniae TaxID=2099 RepID=UPI00136AFD5A|nr:endonuclease/exonuclease/phosphatase family protein [Mesomycoplasma hyopneumoniae]MXR34968.1 nuclease [Mesomycoplasma hyopneumoniae]